MRWNSLLISIAIASAVGLLPTALSAAVFGSVVPIRGQASDIALDEASSRHRRLDHAIDAAVVQSRLGGNWQVVLVDITPAEVVWPAPPGEGEDDDPDASNVPSKPRQPLLGGAVALPEPAPADEPND